ncbi:MAG: hypothetical protein WC531_03135 [Candidatus Paceibacterota bacterium]|jgi:hypothetical protein
MAVKPEGIILLLKIFLIREGSNGGIDSSSLVVEIANLLLGQSSSTTPVPIVRLMVELLPAEFDEFFETLERVFKSLSSNEIFFVPTKIKEWGKGRSERTIVDVALSRTSVQT